MSKHGYRLMKSKKPRSHKRSQPSGQLPSDDTLPPSKKSKYLIIEEDPISSDTSDTSDDMGKMFSFDQPTDEVDWTEWIAATDTRNYVLDDGLLDVLKFKASTLTKVRTDYQDRFIKTIGNYNGTNFVSSIMHQGVKFEKKVIGLIRKKIGPTNVHNIGGDHNPRSNDKYLNTISAMKKEYPIIYQGVVRNYSNQTYGVPDILIRSDWLHKLVKTNPVSRREKRKKAPTLGSKYHYIVLDIKFKTLHLKSDGIHLRNDGPMKAYKSQLCIYTEALGEMQGYEPSIAFIMGWKWKYVSKKVEYKGDNCFDTYFHFHPMIKAIDGS